ncbi:hypothetical protein [Archangium sp.]|uniref:hypothetical protein n=1 Tax=Archangium sp. TaxID=1872627 RepID=UPI00286D106E|nr:hypothetical protein [Archangium sp.]
MRQQHTSNRFIPSQPTHAFAILLCLSAAPALAQETASAQEPSALHGFSMAGSYSNVDSAVTLGYRLRLPSGVQLGLEARHAPSREAYIDGFPGTGGSAQYGTLRALVPLASAGPLTIGFGANLGLRSLSVRSSLGPDSSSLAVTSELGLLAHLPLSSLLTLRAGWLQVTSFQTKPGFAVDALGQVMVLGVTAPVTDSLQLFADLETGGLFGYDGDGGKYLTRGTLGARLVLGGAARRWTAF